MVCCGNRDIQNKITEYSETNTCKRQRSSKETHFWLLHERVVLSYPHPFQIRQRLNATLKNLTLEMAGFTLLKALGLGAAAWGQPVLCYLARRNLLRQHEIMSLWVIYFSPKSQ